MKLILLLLLCGLNVVSAAAQENCGSESSPSLLGLRLQMSPAQVQSVFGKDLKVKFKTRDEKTVFQNYIGKPPPASLAGVRALYLRFIDQRLYQIEVFYEDRPDVKTLQDFTAVLSARFNTPAVAWRAEKDKALINCGAVTLVADKILNPRIEITNETDRARVEARRQEKSKKD